MLPLEETTIGQLLRRTAQRMSRRPALEYGGRIWTYEQMDAEVDQMARQLLCLGVQRGDHVGIWCEAEPDTVFAVYAVTRIGAVAAMLNTSLRRQELQTILRETDIRWLLIGDGYKEVDYRRECSGLPEELPLLRGICTLGRGGAAGPYTALAELPAAPETMLCTAETRVRPQDTAAIIYTSGTTSSPKAVLSSHYSRVNSGIQQAGDLRAGPEDRFCVAMPVFHCFCFSVNVMAACAVGACLYLPESRRTTALLRAVSEGRCTIFSSVPALFHALLCRPDFSRWDLSSLRTGFIGGSLYPPELFCKIDQAFGPQFTLLSSLGQTEATAGITTASMDDPLAVRAATVGHFMDHVEGRIADLQTGRTLPAGQPGEICVRGYGVMQGYYKNPEATAAVLDAEGWLHTGDLGSLDGQGNVRLTGRLKELIIRGGENISPAELENALASDAALAGTLRGCKAVGVPDAHYGEEVCLCIVPHPGQGCDVQAVRRALAARLADYKVPRYILLVDELPQTLTGKVDGRALRRIACERLGL